MKKDMGGAATILGLAGYDHGRAGTYPSADVLIRGGGKCSFKANAFRPGDVLKTRNGITVEVGNTDAEGRLVLADALTEAVAENPALLVDCATLTGAARSALGPRIAGNVYRMMRVFLGDLLAASTAATNDPLWRLPLWQPYRKMIDSKIADIHNAGDSPFGGAITAALFLKEFARDGAVGPH